MNTRDFNPRVACVSALLCAIGLASGQAQAQFSIDPAANVSLGVDSSPQGLAAGDFDGDGDRDLVTTVSNAPDILVLLNDGAGQYTIGPDSFLPPSSSPQDLMAGDFDGDMIVDLAIAVRDPVGSVIIMLGNGNGTFTMSTSITVGDRPYGMAMSDMDDDGDLDLAVANRNSGNANVLTNDGTGGFTAATLPVGGQPRGTAFGDFDDDGDQDLAVTNHDSRTVLLFTNNGGVFVGSLSLSVGNPVRPDGISSADLNGDGLDDLVVAATHLDPPEVMNQATVFINTGAGFDGPFNYDTGGSNTTDIIAADLDCDGLMDLVASNLDSNDISLLRNIGSGTFGEAQRVQTGAEPGRAIAADFDGDGDEDLAVANSVSDDVSVMINQTCGPVIPCPTDVTGDGVTDVLDVIELLLCFGQPADPGCNAADVNTDGVVNVLDVIDLLLAFGTACP